MVWKSAETFQEEERRMSKINAAGLINITLENLWKEGYSAMAKGNLVLWNRKLDAVWLILGGDVGKNKTEETEFNKLDEELHKLGSLSHQTEGFAKIQSDTQNTIAKQYFLLRNKSLFLRRLQNNQGKGTAYDDGDEDDFE